MIKKLIKKYDQRKFDISLLKNINMLNLGAGITRIEIAVNLDIHDKADVTLELGVDPLPFEDNSIDLIYSDHTFEHVKNYLHLVYEVHRVLKKGGCLLICVPYVTLTEYNLVNPYHFHNFNEFSFDFFDPTKLRGSAAEVESIDLRKINHYFSYLGVFRFLPFINIIARKYLFNVVRDIKFVVCKGDVPNNLTRKIAENLASTYREISRLRMHY